MAFLQVGPPAMFARYTPLPNLPNLAASPLSFPSSSRLLLSSDMSTVVKRNAHLHTFRSGNMSALPAGG